MEIRLSGNPDYYPIMQADTCVSSNAPSLGSNGIREGWMIFSTPFHFQPSMLAWAYTWAKIVFSQAAGRLYPKLCRIVLICSCAIRVPFAHFTLWACLWAKNCISETTGWVFSCSNFYRIILPCTCATARPFAHSPLWAWPWAKNYLWNRLTDFSPKFYRIV